MQFLTWMIDRPVASHLPASIQHHGIAFVGCGLTFVAPDKPTSYTKYGRETTE